MKKNDTVSPLVSLSLAFCAGLLPVLFAGSCQPLTNQDERTVRITVIVEGEGSVTGMPADSTLPAGSRLRLTAVPHNGMIFVAWRGNALTTSLNPLDIRIDQDMTVTAYFAPAPGDLAFIPARENSFRMGSSGSFTEESPAHTVRFRYDFFIGRHEVTQGAYAALIGQIPNPGAGALDIGDSFPVYNVKWYDAALYCNALSKRHGYDTVYSYSDICQDPACPWVLENLETHYDRFGYRLPTEAEWEFACRAGTGTDYFWGSGTDAEKAASEYAWYCNPGSSAPNSSQKVARLKPNAFGLYDMAGNVAEWVGDWLGPYFDTLFLDPIGLTGFSQEQYEAKSERPLRGGSWRLGANYLRSSCRKGPYKTSAFAVGNDIGFRVALGAFSPDTVVHPLQVIDSLPVSPACDKTDLFKLIGTSRIKLTFAVHRGDRRELAFFDFSQPGTRARRCGNDTSVFCPAISPDGKFAAYSSSGEGFSGPCVLTVCSLDTTGSNPVRTNGYIPRFWVSPAPRDTFVIYTDGTSPNGNNPRWRTEKTYKRRFQGGNFPDEATVLWNTGSYHGGLSSDGRFLGTSYRMARVVDLQLKDTALFYFAKSSFNGRPEDPDEFPQVCNLSMSPSLAEPGEALLLDFGYPHVSTLLHKSYGLHAVIFICTARLLQPSHVSGWFEKPSGYDQWDYPDWSNHSGFIVSVARTENGGNDALYIIRRKDSAYLKVATGQTLSYPALWIDPAQVSEVDDPYRWFGAYDIPVQWNGHIYLARKMRLFWHYRETAACVAIGSSPIYFGLNPSYLSMPSLNIASCGSNMVTDAVIALRYVLPHCPHLKALVFDLSAGTLDVDGFKSIPPLNGLYDSKGYELDARNDFYFAGLPPQIVERCKAFSAADWPGMDSTGFDLYSQNGNGWGAAPLIDKGDFDSNAPIVRSNLDYIRALADSSARRGIHLFLVSMPESPDYKMTDMIGRYGPGRETYKKIVSWIDTLTHTNGFVHFYDANNYGDHDYPSSEAYDCNHLNPAGAVRFTKRLDSLISGCIKINR